MGIWKAFRKLSSTDRRAVLAAASVIVGSRAALRIVGYPQWTALLSRAFADHIRPAADKFAAKRDQFLPEHLARLNHAVARNLLFKPTCLERSIGLWWLLRRQGCDAQIRIGARKAGGLFEAHAWVECAGVVLNDSSDEHRSFSVFGDSESVAARGRR
jgi:hypothetical protein